MAHEAPPAGDRSCVGLIDEATCSPDRHPALHPRRMHELALLRGQGPFQILALGYVTGREVVRISSTQPINIQGCGFLRISRF